MLGVRSFARQLGAIIDTLLSLLLDAVRCLVLCLRPVPALAAEILLLRKQLALCEERQSALRLMTPETFTRWHRQGFRLFWRWRSNLGGLHHDYRLEQKAA
jgi:hypothetical protein